MPREFELESDKLRKIFQTKYCQEGDANRVHYTHKYFYTGAAEDVQLVKSNILFPTRRCVLFRSSLLCANLPRTHVASEGRHYQHSCDQNSWTPGGECRELRRRGIVAARERRGKGGPMGPFRQLYSLKCPKAIL
jgi:hypothetical protein